MLDGTNAKICTVGLFLMAMTSHVAEARQVATDLELLAMVAAVGASSRLHNDTLPPDSPDALATLNASPRHGEWVRIEVAGSPATVPTWIVYPERSDKAPVVVVISGIDGLSDWVRASADTLAKAGFIALAPDLVSEKAPGGGGHTPSEAPTLSSTLMQEVSDEEALSRIDAVRAFGVSLPASNGKSTTMGFGWGGGRSFAYATVQAELDAAVVVYGPSPEIATLRTIRAPVLGLYGGNDERTNATVPAARDEMARLGKIYEVGEYEGAGHAFLSRQSEHGGANRRATEKGWHRALEFLRRHVGE